MRESIEIFHVMPPLNIWVFGFYKSTTDKFVDIGREGLFAGEKEETQLVEIDFEVFFTEFNLIGEKFMT